MAYGLKVNKLSSQDFEQSTTYVVCVRSYSEWSGRNSDCSAEKEFTTCEFGLFQEKICCRYFNFGMLLHNHQHLLYTPSHITSWLPDVNSTWSRSSLLTIALIQGHREAESSFAHVWVCAVLTPGAPQLHVYTVCCDVPPQPSLMLLLPWSSSQPSASLQYSSVVWHLSVL